MGVFWRQKVQAEYFLSARLPYGNAYSDQVLLACCNRLYDHRRTPYELFWTCAVVAVFAKHAYIIS